MSNIIHLVSKKTMRTLGCFGYSCILWCVPQYLIECILSEWQDSVSVEHDKFKEI